MPIDPIKPVPAVSVKCVAKADQPARRDEVLETDAALAVVLDLQHLATTPAQRFGHRAQVLLTDVDGEVLDRLHPLSVDLLHDGLRARDLELKAFATHRLDENSEVKLAASTDKEPLGGIRVLDVEA